MNQKCYFQKKLYVRYKPFVVFVADPACTASVRTHTAIHTDGARPWTRTAGEDTAAMGLSASETAWT